MVGNLGHNVRGADEIRALFAAEVGSPRVGAWRMSIRPAVGTMPRGRSVRVPRRASFVDSDSAGPDKSPSRQLDGRFLRQSETAVHTLISH